VVLAYPTDDDQRPELTRAFAQMVNACFSKLGTSPAIAPPRVTE